MSDPHRPAAPPVDPDTPASDAPASDATEPEQAALKRAEDSGADATGGAGILTGIAQA